VLKSLCNGQLVVAVPGTDYELHLVSAVAEPSPAMRVGARIEGAIEARALRIHRAAGGGRFIEPMAGAPRIIAGRVLAIDEAGRCALVDVSVPMWVHWPEGQDPSVLEVGQLVNCYVESGSRFRPR
jgi:hypothetical protein